MPKKTRPPTLRSLEIFNAVIMEGRAPEELAAALGIKTSTIYGICSRVRNWMRQHAERERREVRRRWIVIRRLFSGELPHEWN